ncbi:MAG: hypothetical protein IH957_12540 [Chloroflexi bacterium]|nr:hypothetical protein [Chloroflexota bacterium]
MGLIGLLRRKKKKAQEPIEEPRAEGPSGPELFVLVPEIAGAPTYRVNRFPNVDEGTQFIDGSIAPISRPGAHIFWALHEGPSAAGPPDGDKGEALVLIRPARDEDTIHIVSFIDIESAQSFARFEVKRGLDLGLLMIYWAAFAQVVETPFGLRLNPAEPPVYERVPVAAETAPPVEPARSPAPTNGSAQTEVESPAGGNAAASDDDLEPELRIMPEPQVEPAKHSAPDTRREPIEPAPVGFSAPEEAPEPVNEPLDTASLPIEASATPHAIEEESNQVEPIEPAAEPTEIETPEPFTEPEPVQPIASEQPQAEEANPLPANDESAAIESGELALEPTAIEDPQPSAEPEPIVSEQPPTGEAEPLPVNDESAAVEPAELAAEPTAPETPQPFVEPDPVEPTASGQPSAEEPEPLPTNDDGSTLNDGEATVQFTEETPDPSSKEASAPIEEATQDLDEPVVAEAGSDRDEVAQDLNTEPVAELETGAEPQAASEIASESDDDDAPDGDDAKAEIQKILKVKRWEKRDKPFSGFDSPPGRF